VDRAPGARRERARRAAPDVNGVKTLAESREEGARRAFPF
jgi:hypothetical protein